ncbi:RING finger protein 141-like [Gigantopelta aegis]|uniref:RING finger protein 141-like n=1 Tax=Gigantopelta aegis TaxID=1735272 RepID=UPI001B8895DA|nr:RING finger protein 141-like [Gigantopelta aegis]XP_041366239.1 RING finger protein 141-like [Gigantopelta aegis]
MGQGPSATDAPAVIPEQLYAHLDILKHLTTLSYKQFCDSVTELNEITNTFTDHRGKQLQFHIKKGTDTSVFWKATVRVRCLKINTQNNKVESSRALNLHQYIVMYREIAEQVRCLASSPSPLGQTPEDITASTIFEKFDTERVGVNDENECCICMDRKSEIILTCSHEFCEICIDSWNVSHNTCPICRFKVKNSDDTWVLTEKPDSSDYESEVKGYLVGLADRPGTSH